MAIKTKFLPTIPHTKLDISGASLTTDPATRGFVTSEAQNQANAAIVAALADLDAKASVRVAVATNVNLTSPGASLDGVTMNIGNSFLLTAQTNATQNGAWIFNGAAVAATRRPDSDTTGEITAQTTYAVEEGTFGGRTFRVSNTGAITIGTTNITFSLLPVGTTPATQNKNMVCNVTTADGQKATNTAVAVTPPSGSMVKAILLGGYGDLTLGNGTKTGCEGYFADSSNTTARAFGAVQQGDFLYFNGSVAGFQLDATDSISFDYVN